MNSIVFTDPSRQEAESEQRSEWPGDQGFVWGGGWRCVVEGEFLAIEKAGMSSGIKQMSSPRSGSDRLIQFHRPLSYSLENRDSCALPVYYCAIEVSGYMQ